MQLINYFPDANELHLPIAVAKRAIELFIEPFGDKETALSFWATGDTQILVVNNLDDIKILENSFTQSLQQQIDDAINNPEFIEALPDDYAISLTIHSADGHGLYVVRPISLTFDANE
jgi:hypothetical protein